MNPPNVHEPQPRAVIDQGRERIGRLAAPELIDVDQDVRGLEQRLDRAADAQSGCRKGRTAPPRNDKRMRVS